MKPPFYHTILSALHLQDRYGLSSYAVNSEADSVRKSCLDNSPYRDQNKIKWAEFIVTHPSDKAAQYMRKFVE